MLTLKQHVSADELSICTFIMTICSCWLLESILNLNALVMILLVVSIALLITKRKFEFSKYSATMLLYGLALIISLAVNSGNFRILYRAINTLLVILYSFVAAPKINDFLAAKKCMVFYGVFASSAIIFQFLFKDFFYNMYYLTLLCPEAQFEAIFYFNRGYYSGIFPKPHEVAVLITFTMAALVIFRWDKTRKHKILLPMLLFLPLLLTGKRAITVFAVLAMFVLIALVQLAMGHWERILMIIGVGGILAFAAIQIILSNPDVALFARFSDMLSKFAEGSIFDPVRLRLWKNAWDLWLENPVFGIGWHEFSEISSTKLGYSRQHAVNFDFLQFLCENGIVGFILMMLPIVFTLIRAVKLISYIVKYPVCQNQKQLIQFAVFVQIFIFLYAFIEVPFHTVFIFSLYIFSCMIINSFYKDYVRNKKLNLSKKTKHHQAQCDIRRVPAQ